MIPQLATIRWGCTSNISLSKGPVVLNFQILKKLYQNVDIKRTLSVLIPKAFVPNPYVTKGYGTNFRAALHCPKC